MQPKGSNLLFTSCGDRDLLSQYWLGENRNYDLIFYHYGENTELYEKYKKLGVFSKRNKGSKFQNLYDLYKYHKDYLDRYDYIFVLDDDIEISISDINKMFDIARERDLNICQPSLSDIGYIDHRITKHSDKYTIAYSNFVEMNAPLFKKEALFKFLNLYDNSLIGFGMDYLYMQINDYQLRNKYAIIHQITATNPKVEHRQEELNLAPHHSITSVDKRKERIQLWMDYAKKNNYLEKYKLGIYKYERVMGNNN